MRFTRINPVRFPHTCRRFAWLLALALPLAAGAVAIADAQLPVGVITEPYPSYQLTATGGTPPYAWTITAGALPAGLTLQGDGRITGIPAATGSFAVTFQVTGGGTASRSLTQTVTLGPPGDPARWGRRGLQAGAVQAIVVSPNYLTDNTLFAHGAASEVFRSTDRGASWTRAPLAVSAVPGAVSFRQLLLPPNYRYTTNPAAQPESEKTVFAIERDILYKSVDHGLSFIPLRGGAGVQCRSLAASPDYASSGRLWLLQQTGTGTVQLYGSNDRGATWSLVYDFAGTPNFLYADNLSAPDSAGTLFADGHCSSPSNSCVYKSVNGGTSWSPTGALNSLGFTSNSIGEITPSPSYATDQTLLVLGQWGGPNYLYISRNGGASWSQVTSAAFGAGGGGWTQISVPAFISRPSGPPRIVVYSAQAAPNRYALLTSDDYAVTFTPRFAAGLRPSGAPPAGRVAAAPVAATGDGDYFFSGPAGVDGSTDAGFHFTPADTGIDAVQIYSLSAPGGPVAGFAAADSTGWYKTADGGLTWNHMPVIPDSLGNLSGNWPAIPPNYALDRTLFLRVSGELHRSTDGGVSTQQVIPYTGINDIAFTPGFRAAGGVLFVATDSGMLKSTDGGLSYAPVAGSGSCPFADTDETRYLQVSPNYATDQAVFSVNTVNTGGLCKSRDGGATWSSVSPAGTLIPDFVLSPSYNDNAPAGDHRRILFVAGGTVFPPRRSIDGGASFTTPAGLPAGLGYYRFFPSPLFALDATVLMATPAGIYRSGDYGASFAHLTSGDPLGFRGVTAFYFAPGFDGRLSANSIAVALTAGAGIWRSVDGGRTFQPAGGAQTVDKAVNAVATLPGQAGAVPVLFAATAGDGVRRSDDGGLTFASISKGLPADSDMKAVVAPSAQPARPLAARNGDGLWRFDSVAGAWSRHPSAGSGDYRAFGEDGTYLYAMRRDGVSLRSSDGGATWVSQDVSKTDLVSFASGGAAANPTVLNGDFEQPVVAGALTTVTSPGTIGAWTVDSGSVDLIANYWQAADGQQSLDLSGGAAGSITQTLATTAGAQYTLRFSLAANPDTLPMCAGAVKTLQVFWNGGLLARLTADRTGHTTASMGWTTKQFTVTATAATTALRFLSLDSGACGPALDAVSVTPWGAPLRRGAVNPKLPGSVTASLWSVSAGQGPMFSYNSGVNWTAAPGSGDYALPTGQNWQTVQTLGLDAGTGGRIVAAGTTTGLWLTRDGGLSWIDASGAGSGLEATSKNFSTLISALNMSGTTDLLAGVNGSTTGGVYLSGDNGEHWTQVNQGFDPNSLNITTLAKTSCNGCPVQYYSGTYGSGVYTRTLPVLPAPVFPGVNAACFGSTGCACAPAAGSGPEQGGQAFKLCGANFQALATVEFDGVAAGGCTTVNAATITCTGTPPHIPGAAQIRVRNPDTRTGYLPNSYNYTTGSPRVAANSLRISKSGSNSAKLTYTCSGCTAPPPQVYRSQDAAFTLNVEQYSGGAGTYTNTGALAAGANPSYFWSVE